MTSAGLRVEAVQVFGKVFCGHGWWLGPLRAGLVALWDIRSSSPRWMTGSLGLAEAGMAQHRDPPAQRRFWGQEHMGVWQPQDQL